MYKKSFLPILFGLFTIALVASCDKDFNELGTDIVGGDNFDLEKYTDATIKSYNQKLGPIASNNLAINPLGFYENPAFGTTQANFVTQVELASLDPTFNNTDPDDYDIYPTAIDSVILDIPYFRTFIEKNDDVSTYRLDSIYGSPDSKFKLSVYQSNYFLRDLDPGQSLTQAQAFYTDENNTFDNNKGTLLNNLPTSDSRNADGHENSAFYFDKREHKTTTVNEDNETEDTRSVPSMRLHLDNAFFTNLILNAPEGKLETNTVFKNYFRGLYFKVEQGTSGPGHMAMLNFKGGKITIYYNEDKKTGTGTTATYERVDKTFVLNLTGNTVSLLQNTAEEPNYIAGANSPNEATNLYLKGGEGSIGIIDLFGSADNYKYVLKVNGAGKPTDENDAIIPLNPDGTPKDGYFLTYIKVNSPNGISDELDDLRYPLINDDPGQIYHSTKNRWMINEANLTLNIVKSSMSSLETIEPSRIYLYDFTNKKVLVDYSFDGTSNTLLPKFNKGLFGGILLDDNQRLVKQKNDDGEFVNKGSKYKFRITNHIRNLIRNDSTNVRLGIAVTESIANVAFSKLRTPNSNTNSAPSMSVMSPIGTILYGTNPAVPDDKKLKLEIYYTKPY